MRTIEIPGMGGPSTPERQAASEALAAQQEYVASLTAEPTANGHAVEEELAVKQREQGDQNTFIRTPRPAVKVEKVELAFVPDPDCPGISPFRLTFNVSDICIREHYISMLITDDMGFQPSATMRFDLKFRGQVRPVIFMGAEFEFQSLGVRGISFLVDSKRQQRYDQARQS